MAKRTTPNWPDPLPTITGPRPERDMVNLSNLDPAAKREAFARMKQQEPGVANFLAQMGRTFGPSTTFIDEDTAEKIEVPHGRD